jgi:hypothetical protein
VPRVHRQLGGSEVVDAQVVGGVVDATAARLKEGLLRPPDARPIAPLDQPLLGVHGEGFGARSGARAPTPGRAAREGLGHSVGSEGALRQVAERDAAGDGRLDEVDDGHLQRGGGDADREQPKARHTVTGARGSLRYAELKLHENGNELARAGDGDRPETRQVLDLEQLRRREPDVVGDVLGEREGRAKVLLAEGEGLRVHHDGALGGVHGERASAI